MPVPIHLQLRLLICLGFLALLVHGHPQATTLTSIFPLQEKHVHSSSLIELKNGDLLACWYHGSGERTANDVVIQGAVKKRGHDSWNEVFLMADTPGLPDCNPVLFKDPKDRIWLFWIVPVANRWENSMLHYRRMENLKKDGTPDWTWQGTLYLLPGDAFYQSLKRTFQEIPVAEDLWAEYALPYSRMLLEAAQDPRKRQTGWMPRNHLITLKSGRILLPLYSDGFNVSLMALSDDLGETWQASQPLVGLGPIQPSVVEKKDGTLVAYCRDSGGPPNRVMISLSHDQGTTWSAARDSFIPNPGSSLEVIVLSDGDWVMVYNDTEEKRNRLSLALSDDEGSTWKKPRVIAYDPRKKGRYSYPSLIQTRDGLVHVTYSHADEDGATIKHFQCQTDWLTESAP